MKSEAAVQEQIRLLAARLNHPLWRNNSGAARDETGRLVRYGLGNDSKKLSDVWKSSDLIGVTPVRIGPQHVGRVLGVFTAVEVKREGWQFSVNDKRAVAQHRFLTDVVASGGIGMFANSEEAYRAVMETMTK